MKRIAAASLGAIALACALGRDLPTAPDGPDSAPSDAALPLGTQAACRPDFGDRDGWRGGDAAASVVLPGDAGRRSLWLFGDSFVADPGGPEGRAYPFAHNSIAIARCDDDGTFALDFEWGPRAAARPRDAVADTLADTPADTLAGAPRAFFEPDPAAEWVARSRSETGEEPYYWPLSAARLGDEVVVALLRVAPAAAGGPFHLPFRAVGVDLARIENPGAAPATWRMRVATLSDRSDVLPAAALVANRDHLYAFAFLARGDERSPRILVRIAARALDARPLADGPPGRPTPRAPDLASALETLGDDGRWHPGLAPERARILMNDDASEMSVHFDPGLRAWLAVYSDPIDARGGPPSDAIWLRRAPRLEGPWSARQAIARVPELARADGPAPGEPFCYAAKAHPELAGSGELVVTYVCNLFARGPGEETAVLERLRTTPSLYRPRVLRVPLP